jgi:glucose-1-phosphate adenylyltransferase
MFIQTGRFFRPAGQIVIRVLLGFYLAVFNKVNGFIQHPGDSLLCNGVIISGGRVERSILSPDVRINSYTLVGDSILFDGVQVGRHAKIRRTIIDKAVRIPPGFSVGFNLEDDAKRFTVSNSGVVVIPKGAQIGEGN